MIHQPLAEDVVERLLIVKGLLTKIRFSQATEPDRIMLAQHILTSHDAAELAIAAIGQHLGKRPKEPQAYLMNYFPLIEENHKGRRVAGRDFFSRLNDVRVGIKHKGIFPDPKDWKRVGPLSWDYISAWCDEYLGLTLEEVDQSALISNSTVKDHVAAAREAIANDQFKQSLEELGLACHALFNSNRALRNLAVGTARAEDAIKLAAFGVHANDYLALQDFLPQVVSGLSDDNVPRIIWKQQKYGHPANWTEANAHFCLSTFVELAVRIQDADWIPGPFEFELLYNFKITALVDGVKILQKKEATGIISRDEWVVVRILNVGESITCSTVIIKSLLYMRMMEHPSNVPIVTFTSSDGLLTGEVAVDQVRISCVPRELPAIKEYFPNLTEIEYKP